MSQTPKRQLPETRRKALQADFARDFWAYEELDEDVMLGMFYEWLAKREDAEEESETELPS